MTVSNVTGDSTSIGTPLEDHKRDPNAHHNQAHLLYGPDHTDVDISAPVADMEVLAYDGVDFRPDRRIKFHFGAAQPLNDESQRGDLWLVTQ